MPDHHRRDQALSQNPKDIAARGKVPLHLLPSAGRIFGALACRDGAEKYGPYNWRLKPISFMTYLGAIERHWCDIIDGEDLADDSLCEHLGHIIATASILLDARECGTLIDDRPPPGPAPRLFKQLHQVSSHPTLGSPSEGGVVCPTETCPGRGSDGELCEECPRRSAGPPIPSATKEMVQEIKANAESHHGSPSDGGTTGRS